jgi:hypothetical protein
MLYHRLYTTRCIILAGVWIEDLFTPDLGQLLPYLFFVRYITRPGGEPRTPGREVHTAQRSAHRVCPLPPPSLALGILLCTIDCVPTERNGDGKCIVYDVSGEGERFRCDLASDHRNRLWQ